MRERLGIGKLVNPDKSLAQEIARPLRFPAAEKVYSFCENRVEIVEMKVSSGSVLANKKISEMNTRTQRYSILISAIEREGEITVPNGDTEVKEGDILSICATHQELCEFLKYHKILKRSVQYVILLGSERSVYYLAYILEEYGIRIKIISPNREKCEEMKNKLRRANVVCGDFTDREVLEAEGLADADAVVAMSTYDENNIMISLFAKSMGVPKIVTVVSNESYRGIMEKVSLDTVLSPYQVAAEETVQYVRSVSVPQDSRIEALYRIANDKAEALQFKINRHRDFTGKAIKELGKKLKDNVLITSIVRGGKSIVPNGDTVIEGDDSVIVLTMQSGVSSLDDLLR